MTPESFSPFDAGFVRNPYAVYHLLRERDEPLYYEALNCYLLARYRDVDEVVRSPAMLRSLEGLIPAAEIRAEQVRANFHDMPHHEQFIQFSMLEVDGEVHRRMRMVVLKAFTRTAVASHQAMIEEHVDQLLDELLEKGAIDFIADFAARLPGHIIGRILGAPAEDSGQLRSWSEDIVQYFDADRTAENKFLAEKATADFCVYLKALISEREKSPAEDLLSTLLQARKAGEIDDRELISTCMLVLAGGHGSTIDVLGTGLLALLEHPDQLQLLRNDPQLVAGAVQEMLRYESPLPFFHRYASADVEVMGKVFPRGTRFGLLYGSANRDPGIFPEADEFQVRRSPNRHLAFGRGAHLCVGNNLARLNLETAFRKLLQRTEVMELRDPVPDYRPGLSSRGLHSLGVQLSAG